MALVQPAWAEFGQCAEYVHVGKGLGLGFAPVTNYDKQDR